MRGFIADVPLFLPGVAFAAVVGIAVAPALARFLYTRAIVAFLLVLGVGAIVSATLTPTTEALSRGIVSYQTCDLSRLGLASLGELTSINTVSQNVVLFIPLGLALGLLPGTRRNITIVLGAFLLTVFVEMAQLLLPVPGRGCESADIVDNTMGLVIGLSIGLLAKSVAGLARATDE
ncbi:MAG: VanZ family protein [Chloroflexota bacterium]